MDFMEMDDGPPNGSTSGFSDPPPPGTMINHTSADILHELSKLEPFDATTGVWSDFAERLREHFELYAVPSEKRVRILIDRISNATYEKLSEICKPLAPLDKSFDELWAIMDANFNKYSNKFKERVKFNRRYQRAHESVLRYATELRRWGRNCKFPESYWQEALITQFINGIRSEEIRTKLLDLQEDDFDQLVSFASNVEAMLESMKTAANTADSADAEKADENATKGTVEPSAKKKKKANKNQTDGSTNQVAEDSNQPTNPSKNLPTNPTKNLPTNPTKSQPTNPTKNQPANASKNQPTNASKNQPTNKPKNKNQPKSKNQVKKQNANQFKFQNKNQFKNYNKGQYIQPFLNYSNQPGGQFSADVRSVLRNQYKNLQGGEPSNYNYGNRSVSAAYKPYSSLFNR